MRQKFAMSTKVIAFIMALLMLIVSLPVTAFAAAINEAFNNTDASNSSKSEVIKNDVVVLEEDKELRDENIKHFKLSDGTTKAVVYSQAVHYKDADGNWVDIDNALTLNGSEYSSNNKQSIKFANKSGSNGLVSIKDGDYKIDFTPLNTNKVSVVIENPQGNNSRKFEDMSVLNNLVSKAIYTDIYDGIDIEYILVGNNIKENIIVKEKQDTYTFSFELKLNKLSAELKDGAIILSDYDSGERVYEIPVPYMFDANNVYSDSVEYSLVQNNKWKYTFTVTADAEWINSDDRAFPVTIDPSLGVDNNNIEDYTKNLGVINSSTLKVGDGNVSYIEIGTLPTLPKDAYMTGATIKLKHLNGDDIRVGVYAYDANDLSDFNDIQYVLVPREGEYDENGDLICDKVYGEDGWFTWDVYNAVNDWYNDPTQTRIFEFYEFSGLDGDGYIEFAAEESGTETRPVFEVTYRDMKGVESYWNYVSQNVGSAGSGVVNLATGNLMFEISTLTTTENIFGFTPSMIYNSALAGKNYEYSNTQNGYWYSFAATGFKLNMNETLIKKYYTKGNGSVAYYYVWTDADGTEHYFLQSTVATEENVYYDEDGLQLKLIVDLIDDNEKTYCKIVDSAHNERIFYILGGAPVSEGLAVYHLEQLKDRNGNILHFEMDGAHKPNDIRFTPSGTTQRTQLLGPLYNSDRKVALIWCNETKEGVLFRHSSTPTGELHPTGGTYLREALYLKCDSNISWKNVLNVFISDMDNEYEGITVKGIMKYEYNNEGQLISAHDTLSGYKVYYTYSNGKVIWIDETVEIEGQDPVFGQTIGISYYAGYTEVRTSGSDDEYGTSDDLINIYVFDKEGRSVLIYTTDVTRSEIYGATMGEYEDEVERAKNSINVSSVIGIQHANYLLNGNFEYSETETTFWNCSNNAILNKLQGKEEWNNANIKLSVDSNEISSISQAVQLSSGEYTLSLDVNTFDAKNLKIYLRVVSIDEEYIEEIPVNEYYASGSDDFATLNFEVKSVEKSDFTIEIYLVGNEQLQKTEYVTIDNISLIKASGNADYNMLYFSSFDDYERTKINGVLGNWVTNSYEGFWINDEANNYEEGQKFGKSIKINGTLDSKITVKQKIYEASEQALSDYWYAMTYGQGSTGEERVFTLSGFGKATKSMKNNKSKFALRLDITYRNFEEGGDFKTESAYAYFSPGNDSWQYSSVTFILPKGSMVKDITVHCEYSYNEGIAYFDNLSLTCEESAETSQTYYYEDGPNAGKVKAQKSGFTDIVYYVYDDNGNAIDVITRRDRTTYTYDERNNVVNSQYYKHNVYIPYLAGYDAILNSLQGKLHLKTTTTYTYDYSDDIENNGKYGLLLSEKTLENGSSEFTQTKYEYETTITSKIFGALKKTTDSLEKSTQYFYDNKTGRLLSTIEADGTGYYYTYDDIGNMIAVEPATLTSSTPTAIENSTDVQYMYNAKNQLSQIIANGTIYTFTYDDFGKQESVFIGNSEIVKQEYNEYNGKISKIIYSNNTEITFEYDTVGRVTKKTYLNGTKSVVYEYKYDSNGNLSKYVDGGNNMTTIYKYDNAQRLVKTVVYDTETMKNINGISYSYDQDSNVDFLWYDQDYLYDSIEYGRLFHYYSCDYDDADGSLKSLSININGYPNTINAVLNYAYDGFGRYASKSFATSGGINTINFAYLTNGLATSSLVSQYTSTIIKDELIKYNKTFNYVYDDANMNITEVRDVDNNLLYKYTYDELDRLIREDNSELSKTFVYSYDDNGNILSENVYSYTLGDVSDITPMHIYEYSYENENWKDQLTEYNGDTITYDEVGNPLSYWNGMNFTWENINNLSNISWNGKNISYEYNDEGIRTSKTVNGAKHTYVLEDSKILSEAYGDVLLVYLYDESDAPVGLLYRESSYAKEVFDEYYFTKNLQGDIIGIYDNTGNIVVKYSYDAWGNHTIFDADGNYVGKETADFIGNINPFRYRGYFFDSETNFYYLNSRYYDPEIKRFISADSIDIIKATPDALTDKNLYAYCDNNPVMREDNDGEFWHILAGAAIGAVIGAVGSIISDVISGETDFKKIAINAGVSAAFGAVGGALTAIGMPTAASIATGAIMGGLEDTTKQLLTKNPNEELDVGSIITSTIAGGIAGAFTGKGALNDLNQKKYITSQKNIRSKAINSGKPKVKANAYFKKMTNTIYGFGGMASKQAVYRVSTSMGIAWGTNKLLGIDMP